MKKIKTKLSFSVAGIGGSAGGLRAFKELLKNLPDRTGMAFVFIMHLLAEHKSMLAELLAEMTKMPVRRVKNGMSLEANHVYVIPPDKNLSVSGGKLLLSNINKVHMPVDYFLQSLAKEMGPKAIGVVLSGTASDGTLGVEAIKAEGGITFAQDLKTAEYDGMPKSAIASGCVDFVFSPGMIASELARIANYPVVLPVEAVKLDEKGFKEVFSILRAANGLDFTNYKDATISRRVLRRMLLLRFKKLKDYIKFLRASKEEAGKLYEDLLINVTGFFRDPEVFNSLKKRVLPEIIKKKTKNQDIRIWVSGCSSGEDVYSIAMCLLEVMEGKIKTIPVQIFATDVSENSINKARRGSYGKNIKDNISPERLKRFFTQVDSGYKVSKQLRDICIFSKQNVFNDPPFSNIDLIICRNLLIYFQPVLQKKVFQNFHYSLVPGGFLILGSSESVGGYSNFFDTLDRKHRIFVKKHLPVRLPPEFSGKYYQPEKLEIKKNAEAREIRENDFESIIERVLLNEYAPCGALVDNNMEVIQFRGRTGRFLESAAGKPSLNIFKLAREGLLLPLRSAIYKARITKQTVKKEADKVKYNGRNRRVNITVIPVMPKNLKAYYFLVIFEEVPLSVSSKRLLKARKKSVNDEKYVEAMQKELLETKEYLQTVIEGLDSSNEELKTANEEILSSNEELQSANEELETSKEELQSANEELTTTNEELNNRNAEVTLLNNDLINFLSSINMPVIMMDTSLVIRKITAQAEKALNLTISDIGRPINKIKLYVDIPDLDKMLLEVIESLRPKTIEIKDKGENWYFLYIKPYRTMDNKIDGVVAIFVDITERKKMEKEIKSLAKFPSENPDPVLRIREDGTILYSNKSGMELLAKWNSEIGGKAPERWCRMVRENFASGKVDFEEEEIKGKTFSIKVIVVKEEGYANLYGRDITMQKLAEKDLIQREELYRTLIENIDLSICLIDKDYKLIMANSRFCKMFDVTQEEIKGMHCYKVYNKHDSVCPDCPSRQAIASKKAVKIETERIRADGTRLPVHISTYPVYDANNELKYFIKIIEDISELKKIEQAKKNMIRDISHSLKTPIAMTEMAFNIAKNSMEKEDKEGMLKAERIASENIKKLRKDITNILQEFAIDVHKDTIDKSKEAPLKAAVKKIAKELKPLIEEKGLQLDVYLLPDADKIKIDGRDLETILNNLLDNAVKFTDKGEISVINRLIGNMIEIEVKDTGCGISAKDINKVFEKFYKRHASIEGTGLGLSICKELVEMYEGDISIHSEGVGRGTTVVVNLPKA